MDPGRDPASCNIDVSDIVVSKWRLDHGLFGDQKPSAEPQVAGGTAGSVDELWSGRLVRVPLTSPREPRPSAGREDSSPHWGPQIFVLKPAWGDFPGGLVAKTPCSQCRRSGFNLWSGK